MSSLVISRAERKVYINELEFNLTEAELYRVNGPVNLTRLFSITGLDSHPELQYTPFTPVIPKLLQNAENIFSVISKQDILLLHQVQELP